MKDQHSDNELDNLFRDGLEGFEMEPSGKVWENIEKNLDGKSRKPKLIFWLFCGLGVLLTGTAVFFMLNSKSIINNPGTAPLSEKTNFKNVSIPLKAAKTRTGTGKNIPENPASLNLKNTTTTTEHDPGHSDKINSLDKGISTTDQNKNKDPLPLKTNPVTDIAPLITGKQKVSIANHGNSGRNDQEIKNNKNITSDTLTAKKEEPALSTPPADLNKTTTASKKNNTKDPVTSNGKDPVTIVPAGDGNKGKAEINMNKKNTKDPAVNGNDPVVTRNDGNAAITIQNKKNSDSLNAATPADTIAAITSDSSAQVKKDSLAMAAADSAKKVLPPADNPFSAVAISTYFSPDYFAAKVSSAQETFMPGAESHNIRFSFGLKAEFRPVRMLGIQLGLAYSEISQQGTKQRIWFPKNISTPYTFYSSLGEMQVDPDVMKDGFSMMAPLTQFPADYTYSQKVSFINVPLNIKLHFGKKKFSFTVLAGLNTQYAYKQKSQIILHKEHFDNVVNYSDVKVNKINYSALAGLGAEYKINKRIGIYVEPNVRYSVNDLSKVPGISNKPLIIGANTGVTFYLK
jgi:hypothetical protein